MRLILTVGDVFDIEEQGLILTPQIPDDLGFAVRSNDPIQLRSPDGRIIDTHIGCFSSGRPSGGHRFYCIVLPRDFQRKDVPIGTEVWLVDGQKIEGT